MCFLVVLSPIFLLLLHLDPHRQHRVLMLWNEMKIKSDIVLHLGGKRSAVLL